jgi:transient receptor potential cation channel subfamily A protein 1
MKFKPSFLSHTIFKWGESRGCTREEMISFFDSEGNVPLHSAVHGGDIKAVEV